MTYLLDTNVISEMSKDRPHPAVVAWFAASRESELYLSVGVVAEIRAGIERLPPGRRRTFFEFWLTQGVLPRFGGRIVPVDTALAEEWGRCRARLKAAGLAEATMDALIGATARLHGMTVVTRNERDFQPLGIPVLNPWSG